ncbi:UDP-glycosyltransferase UGT5-like [Periplaneta americana]|uniref:UDP-glycosyltransferase UGT5-like n=1 Tax=Periplaneta americana TaxID=6978 RepID=UPI0037E826E3
MRYHTIQTMLRIVFVVLTLLSMCHCARILVLFPFPSMSHKIIATPLLRELATRGHQVTVFSPYPEKQPHPNITDVVMIEAVYMNHIRPKSMFEIRGGYKYIDTHWEMGVSITDFMLEDPKIQALIQAKDKEFDLVIIEAFFNEAFLGFAHKFQAPIIQLSTIDGGSWVGDWVGNTAPYSYVPNNYLPYTERMNFWQRFINTLFGTYILVGRHFCYLPQQDAIMKKHFGASVPSLQELEGRTSLLLLNQHFSLSGAKPLLPNVVPIAGINIPTPRNLTKELQTFMDESPNGVVYFSMGTHLKSSDMIDSMKEAFLNSFSRLKQRVLWKLDIDTLPNLPENVKVSKFLPQVDLLNHPNMRVFITHCGISSANEAAYSGVPVIGIPVFGDQDITAQRTSEQGLEWFLSTRREGLGAPGPWGLSGYSFEKLDLTVSGTDAGWSTTQRRIHECHPGHLSYRENAQRLSRVFRDQPLTPLERAVFWTEYVIRHKGAPHMRSAALDLAWYQYFLLDVIAFLVLAVGSVLLIVFLVLRAVSRKLCSGSKKDKMSHKKKD